MPPAQHRPTSLRLEQLRATALEHHEHHTVMADPQGNEFSAEPAQHSSNSRQRSDTLLAAEAVNQSNSIAGSPTLLGLANLAVRAGSGCPREGFKKARK